MDSLREVETMEGGELADDEEERAEAGEVEKERGVMPEDEEVRAEGGEVEKKTFQCSDCEKHYSFLHKLQHHQTWSCKKKKEVEKIKIDFARRPLSFNVFSVSKKGDIGESSVARDKPAMVELCLKVMVDKNTTFRSSDAAFAASFLKAKMM